jgi:hypothetical protein
MWNNQTRWDKKSPDGENWTGFASPSLDDRMHAASGLMSQYAHYQWFNTLNEMMYGPIIFICTIKCPCEIARVVDRSAADSPLGRMPKWGTAGDPRFPASQLQLLPAQAPRPMPACATRKAIATYDPALGMRLVHSLAIKG